MGIKDWLSAPKTLDKVVDTLIKGGDMLVLTEEERLVYNQKAAEIHLRLTEKIGNESAPTAISRRIVGLMVLGPFAFLSIGSALIYRFNEGVADHWLEIASNFENPALAVVFFYFGGHIAKALKK